MTQDEQDQLARLIGRDLAYERAMLTIIGTPRKNEPAVVYDLLRQNFEMGRPQILARLTQAGLAPNMQNMVADGFHKVSTAILNGVRTGKYQPPA